MERIEPTSFEPSIGLVEDYVQTISPPLAADLRSRFQALQRLGDPSTKAELIAVDLDNRVIHFERNEISGSGWAQTQFRVDGAPVRPIEQLIGFYERTVCTVLAFYPSETEGEFEAFGMARGDDGNWRHLPISPEWENAFGRVRQVDVFGMADGRQFISAVSTNFAPPAIVISAFDPASQSWSVALQEDAPSEDAALALLPGWGGEELTVATFVGARVSFRGASLVEGRLVWGARPPVEAHLGQGVIPRRVIAVKQGRLDQGCFVLTQSGDLLRIYDMETAQPQVEALSGGATQPQKISAITAGVETGDMLRLFAIDANDSQLWLLREEGVVGLRREIVLAPWVPLGNRVSAVASPDRMAGNAEVFFYDLSATVQHLSQEPTHGCWFHEPLKGPTQSSVPPQGISSYAIRVATVRNNVLPVSEQVVEITTDRVCSLTVNGLKYPISPTTPVRVLTDANGRLAVASLATGLSSPSLEFSALSADGPLFSTTLRADDKARRRLAGSDPRFPLTGAALIDNQFLPADTSIELADRAAANIRAVAAAPLAFLESPGGASGESIASPMITRFTFTSDGRFGAESLTHAQWNALLEQQTSGDLAFSLSDVFGDVANFLMNALHWLEDIVVKVGGALVEVTLMIGGAIKQFVLASIDDVAAFLEVFFAQLGRALAAVEKTVSKLINWLREVFDWDDILVTKEVFKLFFKSTFGFVRGTVDQRLPGFLIGRFTAWKAEVESAFDQLERLIGPDLTFNAMVPSSNQPFCAGGPPLLGVAGQAALSEHSVRCDYVRGLLLGTASRDTGSYTGMFRADAQTGTLLDEFIASFQSAFPSAELERSAARVRLLAEQIKDPTSFIEVSLAILLEAVKDLILLILSGLEALILGFCELAQTALQLFEEAFEKPLDDIPVLSGLYEKLTGSKLTLLDAAALLMAAPVTILYKLLYGGDKLAPPFTKQDLDALKAYHFPWPDVYANPQMAAPGPRPMELPPGAAKALGGVNLAASLIYTVFDVALDVDAARENSGKEAELGQLPSIFSVASAVTALGVGAPWGLWTVKPHHLWNPADKWVTANWVLSVLPAVSDTIFITVSKTGRVQRFAKLVGPWISCAEGVIILVTGAGAAANMAEPQSGYKPANQAAVLLPAFPYIAQPLVLLGVETLPSIVAQVALVVIDIGCDMGAPIASVVA